MNIKIVPLCLEEINVGDIWRYRYGSEFYRIKSLLGINGNGDNFWETECISMKDNPIWKITEPDLYERHQKVTREHFNKLLRNSEDGEQEVRRRLDVLLRTL